MSAYVENGLAYCGECHELWLVCQCPERRRKRVRHVMIEAFAAALIAGALAYWSLYGIPQQQPKTPIGMQIAWQWEGCWWSATAPPWSQQDEDWICAA